MDTEELKTVIYRGGVLRFRIPSSWVEEYSNLDGGMFYEDTPDSGTFRVKVITMKAPSEGTDLSALALLSPLAERLGGDNTRVTEIGENALFRYEESTVERETKIKIFYWMVANPVPPQHVRIVTFSYTVLQSQEHTARTQQELQMLDREIACTEFSKQIGVVGG
jgi:hypothetical protein